jgi:putative Mg2+ transporter-C (MgtC) family protein
VSLAALSAFQPGPFLDSCISLGSAFVLGALIGFERQYRQRTAGLRTNTLVAVGAAAFVDIGMRLNGAASGAQVLAYVVSGVGFLGAGVIMKDGLNVRGLNTAATLWGSAAAGAAAGADFVAEALLVTLAVLAANTFLRPLADAINRQPLDEASSEATYQIDIELALDEVGAVTEAVSDVLDQHQLTVGECLTNSLAEDTCLLSFILGGTTAESDALDKVVEQVSAMEGVHHAAWSMRAGV